MLQVHNSKDDEYTPSNKRLCTTAYADIREHTKSYNIICNMLLCICDWNERVNCPRNKIDYLPFACLENVERNSL